MNYSSQRQTEPWRNNPGGHILPQISAEPSKCPTYWEVMNIHPLSIVVVGTPPPHFSILGFGLPVLEEPLLVDFETLIILSVISIPGICGICG